MESLLSAQKIDCLAVTGRTKDRQSALEKISRKGYNDPSSQLTDLSGVRIIVFLESDVEQVSALIKRSFNVDSGNSHQINTERLDVNQNGYRSIHYVCDLGEARSALPEFDGLSGLKVEFQVRTVLQHAWAELAHDRNYKFAGKLPRSMERQLYLYAGLLEIADKGFNELSQQIDVYLQSLREKTDQGDLTSAIDSLSLDTFVHNWSEASGFELETVTNKPNVSELVRELSDFGVETLADLEKIIPVDYVKKAKESGYSTNIYGLVRDWMILTDWRRLLETVDFHWVLSPAETKMYHAFMSPEEVDELYEAFPSVTDHEPYEPDELDDPDSLE
ncbi:putative GTP pyrophosphokinase [Paraburkholderia youngii]|uniref:GTP pyrophosphokinase n=1 Tax=Paraburkholderia youngii TaxID=2782701 RepID=UPI003D1B1A96